MPRTPTKPKKPATIRSGLQDVLSTWDPPAGPTGFEGLVAQALAAFTGYTFRLARSGSQFGRDGATSFGQFAIAMEAKRYTNTVPLQELVGKSTLASFALADGIDLWVLAATVEVGEPTERQLEKILDQNGISVLTLDWAGAGLPPLAVLLASVKEKILEFARPNLSRARLKALAAGLTEIADDPVFEANLDEIYNKLSPGLLGLDAFRKANGAWGETTLADRRQAQRQFSQFLTPLEQPALTANRPELLRRIEDAVAQARADAEGETLVAVLGGEGAGKSWAVTRWWLSTEPRPILLLSIGRIAEQLAAGEEPVEMLARLAAHQSGARDARTISRWRRRIERWSQGTPSRDRFAVLIDGLNETSGKAWAAILRDLLPAIRKLGGVLIATSRQVYWTRDVASRLPPFTTTVTVEVTDYDDDEFADVMARNQVDPQELGPRLNAFMRNPRICALALTILPRLTGVQDLSIERLLMEYWRARLQERDDLIAHNESDFRDLIVRHAREYRNRQGVTFNRDEWRMRSGAAIRHDGRDIANDLTEIEEGRFFDSESNNYRFRPESLRFALGLLVADELREHLQGSGGTITETLARIIDPIRGFDAAADILTSAIAIAVMDSGFPDSGIAGLIASWISLQNYAADAFDTLLPHIAARPDAFLDAYEARDMKQDDDRFLRFILGAAAERETVRDALDLRVERWLGTWSRSLSSANDGAQQARRQAERDAQIDAALASLTAAERAWFDTHGVETATSTGLSMAAILYLTGRPQAGFANGVIAFALAYEIAGHFNWPYDELAWVLRVNRIDPEAFASSLRALVAQFSTDESSPLARRAAAFALRLMGTQADENAAEALYSRQLFTTVQDDTGDPLDPASDRPEGVEAVTARITALDPQLLWNHMGTGSEDHDLKRSFDLLVRFDPEELIGFLDRIAATISTRQGLPLRQLAWRLPQLAPLSVETIAAVSRRIEDLVTNPALAPNGDAEWMTGMMVEAVMPALDGSRQLDLLQSLPTGANYYFRYSAVAKTLPGEAAADRLTAVMAGDPNVLERTLIFLSVATTEVTPTMRDLIVRCLGSSNTEVVAAAAEFARTHDDAGIDDAVLALERHGDGEGSWRSGTISAAISAAIARRGRTDLVGEIPITHLDWVAARMPAALARLADTIEAAIAMLSGQVAIEPPADAILNLQVEDDQVMPRIDLEDRGETFDNSIDGIRAQLKGDPTGERFDNRRHLLCEQLDRFLDSLASAGALILARRPFTLGLDALVDEDPERYAGWLRTILATSDGHALRNLQNLGLALGQHYARIDPALSARTFEHLWRIDPHVNVTLSLARHPLRYISLFGAQASAEINALRSTALESATDDAELESLVLAAEAAGAGDWLAAFIDARLLSVVPADQALAITIASIRPKNLHSDVVLARDWERGFIGEAARAGRSRYQRAEHSEHWFSRAAEANHPHERWRFTELAIAASDRRQLMGVGDRITPDLRRMGGDIAQRLEKIADKSTAEGKKLLYGWKRPSGLLNDMMR